MDDQRGMGGTEPDRRPISILAMQNDLVRGHVVIGAAAGDVFAVDCEGWFLRAKVVGTPGIIACGPEASLRALQAVAAFNVFNEDNDPFEAHEFGIAEAEGVGRFYWKIDYFAPDLLNWSEDPADPAKTVRLITLYLPSEH